MAMDTYQVAKLISKPWIVASTRGVKCCFRSNEMLLEVMCMLVASIPLLEVFRL